MPAKQPDPQATPPWMIARKTRCKTCNALIRAPQDVSLGAAVRRHYWRRHHDVMMARRADREWDAEPTGPALKAVPDRKPALKVVEAATAKKKARR